MLVIMNSEEKDGALPFRNERKTWNTEACHLFLLFYDNQQEVANDEKTTAAPFN